MVYIVICKKGKSVCMKIRSVLSVYKEIRYLKSIIKTYGDSLAQGNYHLFGCFRSMSLEDAEIMALASPYIEKQALSNIKASIACKLNRIHFFKNKKTNGKYEAFYSANNFDKKREVKLFSFKEKKILTICTAPQEAEKQLWQFQAFSKQYPMPFVKASDTYPCAYEISMVDLQAFPGDVIALGAIAECGMKAIALQDAELQKASARELIAHSYENTEMNEMLAELISHINDDLLAENIPLCLQHGDLSKDNLIYGDADGKRDFWWIDWEHVAKRPFFYDYFFYILNSAIYFDNKALQSYMRGEGDASLSAFFAAYGLTYDFHKKKDYFLLFAIVFLKERICDRGNIHALKMYFDFLKQQLDLSAHKGDSK